MRDQRRGYLMLELGIAAVVLGGLMTTVLQIVVHTAAWRRESQDRALAAEQAASLLEQCVSLPHGEITREKLGEMARAQQAEQLLPDESVNISLDRLDGGDADGSNAGDGHAGQRIAVEIRWKNAAGNPQRPVRLATWVFDHHSKESP